MSTPAIQPPSASVPDARTAKRFVDPALTTPRGRRQLIGLHVDEALSRCRGYEVAVVYGQWGSRINHTGRPPAGEIVIALNGENRVTAVR